MADGMHVDRSSPWRGDRPPGTGVERAARTTRDRQRRDAKRQLLQSVRDTLAEAEPLAESLLTDPANSAALAETRARIVAAVAAADGCQTEMGAGESTGHTSADDPAIIAAARALAAHMSSNRKESIATQARITAEAAKLVIDR